MYLHAYNTAEAMTPSLPPHAVVLYISRHDQVAGFTRKHRGLLIQATQPSILKWFVSVFGMIWIPLPP